MFNQAEKARLKKLGAVFGAGGGHQFPTSENRPADKCQNICQKLCQKLLPGFFGLVKHYGPLEDEKRVRTDTSATDDVEEDECAGLSYGSQEQKDCDAAILAKEVRLRQKEYNYKKCEAEILQAKEVRIERLYRGEGE